MSTARRAFVTSVVVVGVVAERPGALAPAPAPLPAPAGVHARGRDAAGGWSGLHEHGVPRAARRASSLRRAWSVVVGLFSLAGDPAGDRAGSRRRSVTRRPGARSFARTSPPGTRRGSSTSSSSACKRGLQKLPSGSALVHPALTVTTKALEVPAHSASSSHWRRPLTGSSSVSAPRGWCSRCYPGSTGASSGRRGT